MASQLLIKNLNMSLDFAVFDASNLHLIMYQVTNFIGFPTGDTEVSHLGGWLPEHL